ncbi:hypothetical protein COOONC_22960 [Cooperia oncophora]
MDKIVCQRRGRVTETNRSGSWSTSPSTSSHCCVFAGSDDDLVAALASFLQDDALSIREEVGLPTASSLLSKHILKSNILLNPGVCYRPPFVVIMENIPHLESENKELERNVRFSNLVFS